MGEFYIPIIDVIRLLGLPEPDGNRSNYYIHCPNCDDYGKRSKHLNINLVKNIFRCPRCGVVHGGVLDFYSLFTGVPRDRANDDLRNRLLLDDSPELRRRLSKPRPQPKAIKEVKMLGVDQRDAVYRSLLSKLDLIPHHMENLRNRGLLDSTIEKNIYKSVPDRGKLKAIASSILQEGHKLGGIPGFYVDDKDKKWTLSFFYSGMLFPVVDINNKIQGIQIRKDNVEKRKFRWFSSAGMKMGSGTSGFVHIAGPVQPRMLIIEGPLKADIVYQFTGISVVAVPGVNTLPELESVLKILWQLGLREIMTCFDMDMHIKYSVQNGYAALTELLLKVGFRFGTYVWNPLYSGLDDCIWEKLRCD